MNTQGLRKAVQAHIKSSFPSAEVVGGKVAGSPSRRERDHITVFSNDYEVLSRSTSLAQPAITIRHSPQRAKNAPNPPDPGPLEDAMDALIAAFPRASQVGGYFLENVAVQLVRVTINDDPDVWHVEAELRCYTLSGAA